MATSDDVVVTRVMEAINLPGVDRGVAVAAIDACRNARPSGVMSTADGTDYARGYRDGESAARAWAASWLRETADEPSVCHANACDALRDAADALAEPTVPASDAGRAVEWIGEVVRAMRRNDDARVSVLEELVNALASGEHMDGCDSDGARFRAVCRDAQQAARAMVERLQGGDDDV